MHTTLIAASLTAQLSLAGEFSPSIVGRYRDESETEITAALTLKEGGVAQYTVTWFNGDGSKVEKKYEGSGTWIVQGEKVTLTLPVDGLVGRIEYRISTPCPPSQSSACTHGLKVVSTSMPRGHSWDLWRSGPL